MSLMRSRSRSSDYKLENQTIRLNLTKSLTTLKQLTERQLDLVRVLRNAEDYHYKWDGTSDEFNDELYILNPTNCIVVFKLKRTSPKIIGVSPGFGYLKPQQLQVIKVAIKLNSSRIESLKEENRITVLVGLAPVERPQKSRDAWENGKQPVLVVHKKIPLRFVTIKPETPPEETPTSCPCCETTEEADTSRMGSSSSNDDDDEDKDESSSSNNNNNNNNTKSDSSTSEKAAKNEDRSIETSGDNRSDSKDEEEEEEEDGFDSSASEGKAEENACSHSSCSLKSCEEVDENNVRRQFRGEKRQIEEDSLSFKSCKEISDNSEFDVTRCSRSKSSEAESEQSNNDSNAGYTISDSGGKQREDCSQFDDYPIGNVLLLLPENLNYHLNDCNPSCESAELKSCNVRSATTMKKPTTFVVALQFQ